MLVREVLAVGAFGGFQRGELLICEVDHSKTNMLFDAQNKVHWEHLYVLVDGLPEPH